MSAKCVRCNDWIESQGDLVVSFSGLKLKPFHSACYATSLRDRDSAPASSYPINGLIFTRTSLILALVGLIFLLAPRLSFTLFSLKQSLLINLSGLEELFISLVFIGVFFGPGLIRFYSWDRFERRMRK